VSGPRGSSTSAQPEGFCGWGGRASGAPMLNEAAGLPRLLRSLAEPPHRSSGGKTRLAGPRVGVFWKPADPALISVPRPAQPGSAHGKPALVDRQNPVLLPVSFVVGSHPSRPATRARAGVSRIKDANWYVFEHLVYISKKSVVITPQPIYIIPPWMMKFKSVAGS
jgi:hypothetical protein